MRGLNKYYLQTKNSKNKINQQGQNPIILTDIQAEMNNHLSFELNEKGGRHKCKYNNTKKKNERMYKFPNIKTDVATLETISALHSLIFRLCVILLIKECMYV